MPFYFVMFCSTGLAETSYFGLTPGISSRDDADSVLGQPARIISDSLLEQMDPSDCYSSRQSLDLQEFTV